MITSVTSRVTDSAEMGDDLLCDVSLFNDLVDSTKVVELVVDDGDVKGCVVAKYFAKYSGVCSGK